MRKEKWLTVCETRNSWERSDGDAGYLAVHPAVCHGAATRGRRGNSRQRGRAVWAVHARVNSEAAADAEVATSDVTVVAIWKEIRKRIILSLK